MRPSCRPTRLHSFSSHRNADRSLGTVSQSRGHGVVDGTIGAITRRSSNVYAFLRKHEEDEQQHLAQFETLIGRQPRERERLPSVPRQWPALAVQLYGYESLGLEFATLLVTVRPDLVSIREDELVHVEFFAQEIHRILAARPSMPNRSGSPRLRGGGIAANGRSLSQRGGVRSVPHCAGRKHSFCNRTALHHNGLVTEPMKSIRLGRGQGR